jgi:hypothetical protein
LDENTKIINIDEGFALLKNNYFNFLRPSPTIPVISPFSAHKFIDRLSIYEFDGHNYWRKDIKTGKTEHRITTCEHIQTAKYTFIFIGQDMIPINNVSKLLSISKKNEKICILFEDKTEYECDLV